MITLIEKLLQQRVNILDLDLKQTIEDLNNGDMIIDEDDYSFETSLEKQNLYYQEQKVNTTNNKYFEIR
jgi:hypothetical protein